MAVIDRDSPVLDTDRMRRDDSVGHWTGLATEVDQMSEENETRKKVTNPLVWLVQEEIAVLG